MKFISIFISLILCFGISCGESIEEMKIYTNKIEIDSSVEINSNVIKCLEDRFTWLYKATLKAKEYIDMKSITFIVIPQEGTTIRDMIITVDKNIYGLGDITGSAGLTLPIELILESNDSIDTLLGGQPETYELQVGLYGYNDKQI